MLSRTSRRWYALPLAALIAGLALVACGGDNFDDDDADGFRAASTAVQDEVGSLSGGGNATTADFGASDEPGAGTDIDALSTTRKIIFTSGIELEVEDVTASFQSVAHIAGGAGGFVEASDLTKRTSGDSDVNEYATITIRVPATKYQEVLEDLRTLPGGEVVHEDSRSSEVTEEYADVESRIRNLERTEARYLQLLEEADTIQDILLVTDRLDGVREQIERLQGRLNLLDDLVDLATAHVTLTPVTASLVAENGEGPASPLEALGEAWDASIEVVRYVGVLGAYAAVAGLWLGPIVAIGIIGERLARRRRASGAH